MSFTITNTIAREVIRQAHAYPGRIAAALFQEMLIEEKESRNRTPVDTGALRASHMTDKPKIDGSEISCAILVGGPSAPYALIVHEDLDAYHKVGQAKFLESTLMESAPHMTRRVAARILGLTG